MKRNPPIELICSENTCGKIFLRKYSEAQRCKLRGLKSFCSRKCAGIALNKAGTYTKNLGKYLSNLEIANNILKTRGRRNSPIAPFRKFIRSSKYRTIATNKEASDLTAEYLLEIWNSQNGKCKFTNWDLILPKNTSHSVEYIPNKASIDRIDNSRGYIKGNVRFIALMANLARQSFSDDQVVEFCKAVALNHQ